MYMGDKDTLEAWTEVQYKDLCPSFVGWSLHLGVGSQLCFIMSVRLSHETATQGSIRLADRGRDTLQSGFFSRKSSSSLQNNEKSQFSLLSHYSTLH